MVGNAVASSVRIKRFFLHESGDAGGFSAELKAFICFMKGGRRGGLIRQERVIRGEGVFRAQHSNSNRNSNNKNSNSDSRNDALSENSPLPPVFRD